MWTIAVILGGCGARPVTALDGTGGQQGDGVAPTGDHRAVGPRDSGATPERPRLPDLRLDRKLPPDRGLPPDADTSVCDRSKAIQLKNDQLTIYDEIRRTDSVSYVDYFPNGCTGQPTPGAERFYRIDLMYGYLYTISLSPGPTFNPALYLISSCADPQHTCVDGRDSFFIGRKEALTYAPPRDGSHVIGVDSRYPPTRNLSYGPFKLDILATKWAYHDECSRALSLKTVNYCVGSTYGSTTAATNEYGGSIQCGLATKMVGPQRYHLLTVPGGSNFSFEINLAPKFRAMLYLFPASACGSAAKINASCGSKGKTGAVMGPVASGTSKSLSFIPGGPGQYVIAVDSDAASRKGEYTLRVTCSAGQSYRGPELSPPP